MKKKSLYTRLDIIMTVIMFSLYAITAILLSALRNVLIDNVLVPIIIPQSIEALINIIDFSSVICGLTIITAVFFMALKHKFKYILIYISALIFRWLSPLPIVLLMYGSIDLDEILQNITALGYDLIIMTIMLIVINAFSKSHLTKAALTQMKSLLFNDDVASKKVNILYPFQRLYKKSNPLQGCLLTIGIIMSVIRLIFRTIDLLDIVIGSTGDMPIEMLLTTIGGYTTDILLAIAAYALSCWLLSLLYSKNEQRIALAKLYKNENN